MIVAQGAFMSNYSKLLIKDSQVLLPDGNFFLGDVQIQGDKITQIAPEINPQDSDSIIDAKDLILLPGVIDPQVHFREPGLEYKEDPVYCFLCLR
jgi:dihydroorotase